MNIVLRVNTLCVYSQYNESMVIYLGMYIDQTVLFVNIECHGIYYESDDRFN